MLHLGSVVPVDLLSLAGMGPYDSCCACKLRSPWSTIGMDHAD
jgi:hypothetical protein